jgi:hypothetical protein
MTTTELVPKRENLEHKLYMPGGYRKAIGRPVGLSYRPNGLYNNLERSDRQEDVALFQYGVPAYGVERI